MHLIVITFEVEEEEHEKLFSGLKSAFPDFEKAGFHCSLFRDRSGNKRVMMILRSASGPDSLAESIHNNPDLKKAFELIQKTDSKVLLSFFDEIGSSG
jgi:hypothetical protein